MGLYGVRYGELVISEDFENEVIGDYLIHLYHYL